MSNNLYENHDQVGDDQLVTPDGLDLDAAPTNNTSPLASVPAAAAVEQLPIDSLIVGDGGLGRTVLDVQ